MKRILAALAALVSSAAATIVVLQYFTGEEYFYGLLSGNSETAPTPTSLSANAQPESSVVQPAAVEPSDPRDVASSPDSWAATDTSQGYRLFVHPTGFSLKVPLQFDRQIKQTGLATVWEFQTSDGTASISVTFIEDPAAEQRG